MHATLTPAVEDILKEELSLAVEATEEPECETSDNPFPVNALPAVLEEYVRMVAEHLQVPFDLVGPCVLATAAAACGKGIQVESRTNRYTRANMFVVIAAPSGTGKSEVMRLVQAPFSAVEQELMENHNQSVKPRLEAEKARLEGTLRLSSGKKGGDAASDAMYADTLRRLEEIETQLVKPRFKIGDATSEKLLRVVSEQNETIFSAVSEGRNVVAVVTGRYRKGSSENDEGIYLVLFSGDNCVVDRVHSGSVSLKSPCGTVLWMIQPDLLEEILANDGLRNGGFLQRCFIVHSRARRQLRGEQEPPFNQLFADNYNAAIEGLLRRFRMHKGDAYTVQPDEDAKKLMRDYYNSTVDPIYDDVATFVSRFEEKAWRVAVTIHAVEHGEDAHKVNLSGDTAARAIAIATWFGDKQLGLLESGREKRREAQMARLLELIARKYTEKPEPMSVRKIGQHAHMDRDAVEQLLTALVATGHLETSKVKPSSGPSYDTYTPTSR